jgi:hypothetical protein
MHDNNGQATSQQSTIEPKAPVTGQGDACSRNGGHNDSKHPNIDPRTPAEQVAAAAANRAAQAKHALPEIEQCTHVPGQANPNASAK